MTVPASEHAIVLVSRLHQPTLRALGYATSTRPATLQALTVRIDPEQTAALEHAWEEHEINVPLVVLDSPYRRSPVRWWTTCDGMNAAAPGT